MRDREQAAFGFWKVFGLLAAGAALQSCLLHLIDIVWPENPSAALPLSFVSLLFLGAPLLAVTSKAEGRRRLAYYFCGLLPIAYAVALAATLVSALLTYHESDVSGSERWAVPIIGAAVFSVLMVALLLPVFSRISRRPLLIIMTIVALPLIAGALSGLNQVCMDVLVDKFGIEARWHFAHDISEAFGLLWQIAVVGFIAVLLTGQDKVPVTS